MSNKNGKTVDNEQRTDTIVGIVTVAVVLALFVWLFVSMSMRGNAISNVAFDGEVRRGQEQVFTADVKSSKIKDGETVKWTKEDASNTFGKDEEKNWWNWGTVIYPTLSLEAGRVTIEITTTKLPVSFDWMEFVASEPVQA